MIYLTASSILDIDLNVCMEYEHYVSVWSMKANMYYVILKNDISDHSAYTVKKFKNLSLHSVKTEAVVSV